MADPKHPEHFDDPASIPVLTDVIVPGRPPMPHPGEAHTHAAQEEAGAPATPPAAPATPPAPDSPVSPEAAAPVAPPTPAEPQASLGVDEPLERDTLPEPLATPQPAELTERDAEHIAERLRARFAGYLREEGSAVIEARCREALEEHASWLVRQVTREVARALEGEVAGWVRDALREELAAHQTARR